MVEGHFITGAVFHLPNHYQVSTSELYNLKSWSPAFRGPGPEEFLLPREHSNLTDLHLPSESWSPAFRGPGPEEFLLPREHSNLTDLHLWAPKKLQKAPRGGLGAVFGRAKVPRKTAVSYTHLTLPTIYSV